MMMRRGKSACACQQSQTSFSGMPAQLCPASRHAVSRAVQSPPSIAEVQQRRHTLLYLADCQAETPVLQQVAG